MDQRSIFVMSLIRFEEINGNEFSFRSSEDELEQDIIHGIEVLFRQLGKISTIADFIGSQLFFQQIHPSFLYYIMKNHEKDISLIVP